MTPSFSKSEKKRINRVLRAQRMLIDQIADYTNDHGGCPNCGDIHTETLLLCRTKFVPSLKSWNSSKPNGGNHNESQRS